MKHCPVCEKTYSDEASVCIVDSTTLSGGGPAQDPVVGRMLKGRFRVISKIDAGGMGTVYLAEQVTIGRKVALKILHGRFVRDDEFVRRFRDEAKTAASVKHRNVIIVYDYDQAEDGSLFIAMEYLEGRTLADVFRQEGALDMRRAVRLGMQIAGGLEAAHRAGVIHRDIKPHNIMVLGPGDEVKLMDFGIARLRDTERTGVTRTGSILGTPEYMAPEQIEGGEITEGTDIYALGIVLYQMMTGIVPFTAPTPTAILNKHLHEAPTPPRQVRRNIPLALERVVMKALEKKPERRQREMGEVLTELRLADSELADEQVPKTLLVASPEIPVVGPETLPVPEKTSFPPTFVTHQPKGSKGWRSERWALTGPAALLLGLVAWAAWLLWLPPPPDRNPHRIRAAVEERLRGGGFAGLTAQVSSDRVVTLWGALSTREKEQNALQIARAVPGITKAISKIRVQPSLPPPERIRELVEKSLRTKGWVFRVDVSADRLVTLRGTVDNPVERDEAIRLAGAVPGVQRVISQVDILPPLADIQGSVEETLKIGGLLRGNRGDSLGIIVDVSRDRVVALRGVLETTAEKDRAIRLAKQVAGVAGVKDEINVREIWKEGVQKSQKLQN